MLVLSRNVGQSICIGDAIELTVVRIKGDKAVLGIAAPIGITILRKELIDAAKAGQSVNVSGAGSSAGSFRELG